MRYKQSEDSVVLGNSNTTLSLRANLERLQRSQQFSTAPLVSTLVSTVLSGASRLREVDFLRGFLRCASDRTNHQFSISTTREKNVFISPMGCNTNPDASSHWQWVPGCSGSSSRHWWPVQAYEGCVVALIGQILNFPFNNVFKSMEYCTISDSSFNWQWISGCTGSSTRRWWPAQVCKSSKPSIFVDFQTYLHEYLSYRAQGTAKIHVRVGICKMRRTENVNTHGKSWKIAFENS